ncbi:hypothetical protein DM47_697 [Burkholderia mallei]|nr:hypothetical protein DM47_697 [Burkholderia mallei]
MVGQVRRAVGERTARMPKGCVSEVGIGCFRDEGQEGEGAEEPEACRPEDPKTRRPEDPKTRRPVPPGSDVKRRGDATGGDKPRQAAPSRTGPSLGGRSASRTEVRSSA